MYTISPLKVNKFRLVSIPKPRDLFARFGMTKSTGGQYSGDEVLETGKSKVEQAADAENLIVEKD